MQAVAAPDAAPAAAPMVLLHEGLGSVSMWRDWPSRVARATGRAIWVHSRRGYGQSDAVTDVRRSGRLPPDYLHREAWNVLPVLLAQWGLQCPVLRGTPTVPALLCCLRAAYRCRHVLATPVTPPCGRGWRLLAMERRLAKPGLPRVRRLCRLPPDHGAGAGPPGQRRPLAPLGEHPQGL